MTDSGSGLPRTVPDSPQTPVSPVAYDGGKVTEYTTLAARADLRHELTIKRSRFITVLQRVGDEDAARSLVAQLRREFHDARHHCSAFVVGPDRSLQRSNDDGEPAGTAGLPMLDALLKWNSSRQVPGAAPATDLSDVCAVVVRYFGGVLLGAGGLVRAYSDSVSQALDHAVLVRRRRLRLCTVEIPHAEAGRLENELRQAGFLMTGNRYGARITALGLAVEDSAAALEDARVRLAALSAGAAELVLGGMEWADVPYS